MAQGSLEISEMSMPTPAGWAGYLGQFLKFLEVARNITLYLMKEIRARLLFQVLKDGLSIRTSYNDSNNTGEAEETHQHSN